MFKHPKLGRPLKHLLQLKKTPGTRSDVRVSTQSLAQNELDWNRGAIVNYYGGAAWGQSSTTNNGNLTKQQHWVPANESLTTYNYTEDSFTYDSLNRLTSVTELPATQAGYGSTSFVQAFDYDRWGNRTINQTSTTGPVPKPNFGVNTANNRLTAPSGSTMTYDQAGNLTFDNSDGIGGARTYDAENKMKQAWTTTGTPGWQTYAYDGDGHRIKRIVNGTETWQVTALAVS